MTVLTDICSGPECTNRPQWSWPASPEAPTYNSTYIWGQEPHFSSAWGLQPLPQLFCRSAGLSTAYIWPWTLLIWTLICRLTSQLDLRAVLSPWICLAQANGLDPSLTTSATSVPACPPPQFRAVDGAGEPPAPLSSLCLREHLALAAPWCILPSMVFTELSWKNLGNSHPTTKPPLPQLKHAQAKASPETTHCLVNVKPLA